MTAAESEHALAPRGRAGRAGWGVGLYFFFLAPAAVGGGLFLAPWLTISAMAAAPLRFGRGLKPFLLATLPFVLLAAWAFLSRSWTAAPTGGHDLKEEIKIALVFASGLVFVAACALAGPADRRLIRAAGVASLLILIFALGVEALGDMPINRLAQPDAPTTTLARNPAKGAAVLVALCWGMVGSLADIDRLQSAIWRVAIVAAALLSLCFDMNANALAFLAGAAAFAFAFYAPRLAPLLISSALAAWMLVAPIGCRLASVVFANAHLPDSWKERLVIWRFATDRIHEKPLFGWGVDSSRIFTGFGHVGNLEFRILPLHPHSASLHVWLELGAVGAVLAALCILVGGISVSRALGAYRNAAAAACGSMAAIGVIWNVSFGAFQEWWMVIPFVAGGLAAVSKFAAAPKESVVLQGF